MNKGYTFKRERCPVCGRELGENWIVRHLKKEHSGLGEALIEAGLLFQQDQGVKDEDEQLTTEI